MGHGLPDRPLLGGHLAFHAAVDIPERLTGVVALDLLGAVGDGGAAAFGAEMLARVPDASRNRVRALEEGDAAGEGTLAEAHEALSLSWPSYFARPAQAPPMPDVEISHQASQGLWADLAARLPDLESSLPSITVPVGVVVGELSPMPVSAGIDTADRIPGAWSHIEPGAGLFLWFEAPGCVLAAVDRLFADTCAT